MFAWRAIMTGLAAGVGFCPAQAGLFELLSGKSNKPAAPSYHKEVQPLLARYCFDCHGEKQKGDLDLRLFKTETDVEQQRKVFEQVLKALKTQEMPPEGKPKPTEAERERMIAGLDALVFKCDCKNPDPGRVTIRRLNRTEYNNTIRDLLGVDFQPAEDFPADDIGYGFDNIGDVLSLPPILFEKYLAAADRIVDAAIWDGPGVAGPTNLLRAARLKATGSVSDYAGDARILFSQGEVFTIFTAPRAGDYQIRFRAFGQQAGKEPARAELKQDGKVLKVFDVTAVEREPKAYGLDLRLEPGEHKVAVAFINDFYDEKLPRGRQDRNLIVQHLEIIGPLEPKPMPEFHRRHLAGLDDPARSAQLLSKIVADFARRAFRRPVQPDEVNRLMELVGQAQKAGDTPLQSLKVAFKAILISPHFLFRGELQPEPDNPKVTRPIGEFALASRLSYFLWSSMPDEPLFQEAASGTLRKNLEPQVRRMLRDPKAGALVKNFAAQWLQLRKLMQVTPDPATFPNYNEGLRDAMLRETELFFEGVREADRPILDFLDADYTYLNESLARHYGIRGVKGDDFRKVSLKGTPRGGLLTQASILTLTSNPTRTSPVKRGKWVLDNLLGSPPPPPPPEVPELAEKGELHGTLRQRLEQHRANPMCFSCHARMDPIGFGLENFDAIGGWRTKDGKEPLDTAGKLVSGETFTGHEQLQAILVKHKREEFVRCFSEKLLTYALGRGLEYYDRCAVDQITKGAAKGKYRFSAVVLEITRSVPFQNRRGEGGLVAEK